MLSLIAPHFTSLYASAQRALIQIPPIIPTVDPITFSERELWQSDSKSSKVNILSLSTTGKCHKNEMKGARQNATGGRQEVETRFLLLPLIVCCTWLSRWDKEKKLRKPGVKTSRRQEWNENRKWELPCPTKTHLSLTCVKQSRLRWASSHGWFALLLHLLKLRWIFLASPTCDEDTCH